MTRRRYARWTAAEDRVLLGYRPGGGVNLREFADRMGRTYYAVRIRRKELLTGRIVVGEPSPCGRCGRPLPRLRRRGYCGRCRRAARHERSAADHQRLQGATLPTAVNRYRLWTADEDAAILAEHPTLELARRLGRTLGACLGRRNLLLSGKAVPGGQQAPRGGNHGAGPHDRCLRGHPFDEANIYIDPQGQRHCRACMALRSRAYRERLRQRIRRAAVA